MLFWQYVRESCCEKEVDDEEDEAWDGALVHTSFVEDDEILVGIH